MEKFKKNTIRAIPPPKKTEHSAKKCSVFSIDPKRVQQARKELFSDEQARDITETFKVLAHPSRVKMLKALSAGEMCVCEISEVIGLSISATSHQLHQLRNLRFVRCRTEGKLIYYSLEDPFLLTLLDDCARHLKSGESSS